MKLTMLPERLKEALGPTARTAATKSSLTVLTHVLLRTVGNDTLLLAGTNLERTVTVTAPCKVEEPGEITLPARTLADYVELLTNGEALTLAGEKRIALECGRHESKISGISGDEFPSIPTVDGGPSLVLDAHTLREALLHTTYAAAPDDTRPVLAGVLMLVEGGRMTLAAADGFRLAICHQDIEDAQTQVSCVVPAKTLAEVLRSLPDDETVVEILLTADQSQILVRWDRQTVISRLIEGQFPDFNRIIPRELTTTITVQTASLLNAVKSAMVFARDNSMIVRLGIVPSEFTGMAADDALGKVTVSAMATEVGEGESVVDAVVKGDAMQVAFNGKYLRDALEATTESQCVLGVTGPASPGVLHPPEGMRKKLTVLMTMHVAR